MGSSICFIILQLGIIFVCHSNTLNQVTAQDWDITPLWDNEDDNSTLLCNVQSSTNDIGKIIYSFTGDPYEFCSLNITKTAGSAILLEVLPQNNSYLGFVFLEREGTLDVCTSRYVYVGMQAYPCHIFLLQGVFQLHVLGEIDLSLQRVMSPIGESICPESDKDFQMHEGDFSEAPQCAQVSGYNEMITCTSGINGAIDRSCKIAFSRLCEATLSHREVIFTCTKQHSETALLIIPNIIRLDLSNNQIAQITQYTFQGMPNLEVLNLGGNLLQELHTSAFHGLDLLTELDLSENQLMTINMGALSGLPELSVLKLFRNKLATLDSDLFSKTRKLTYLDLDGNDLHHLPLQIFHNLTLLEYLRLLDIQLTALDANQFKGLTALNSLTLSKNNYRSLPGELFQDLHNLTILYISRCQLLSLNESLFQGLSNLQRLTLYTNMLTTLPPGLFHGLHNLTLLYLHNNQLVELHNDSFHDLGLLTDLALSTNKLTILPPGLFYGLHNLNMLYLHNNQLIELYNSSFRDLSLLTNLALDTNNLTFLPPALFHNLTSLERLFLYQNKLTVLHDDQFQNLTRLTRLSLQENELIALPDNVLYDLTSLQYLQLFENNLTTIMNDTFQSLHNLELITLHSNPLKELHIGAFHGLISLNILYMYDTKLSLLPAGVFDDLISLQTASLKWSQILAIDINLFSNMSRLNSIDMPFNNVSILSSGVFSGVPNLQKLFIDKNKLYRIDFDVFHPTPHLTVIALQGNYLVELSTEIFAGLHNLEGLGLSQNPNIQFHVEIFKDLTNIKNIFLNEDGLQNLPDDIFLTTLHLEFLDMSKNKLQQIPRSVSKLAELTYLNIKDNPLTMVTHATFSSLSPNTELFVSQHEICECLSPAQVICSAADKRSPYLTCDRLLADRTLVVIMWIIGLNALGGNIFVLAWRKKTTQKNKVQSMLLSSLATSDLLMGVYMLIVASADVYFGDKFPLYSESWRSGSTCKLTGALSIFSSEASVFFVTLISIDRFISVRFPYAAKRSNRHSAQIIVFITWLVAFSLGIVPSMLAGRNFKFYDNSHVCIGLPLALTEVFVTDETTRTVYREGYSYNLGVFNTTSQGFVSGMHFSTAVFLGLNLLCYLTIFACYVEIVRAVYKSSKRAGLNKEMKEQLRMTAKVAAIVITDFACWFPIILLGILVQAGVLTLPPSVFAWSVTFVLPINSAINPYLYTIAAIISSRRKEWREVSAIRTGTVVQDCGPSETQVTRMNLASTVSHIEDNVQLPNVPTSNGAQESNV